MWVVNPSTVHAYARQHPTAAAPLRAWLRAVTDADWRSIDDVRRTFPHADSAVVASGRVVTIF